MIRETEARVAPLLAAHADAISLDPALFSRLDTLHAVRHELGLDAESLRLLERRHRDAGRAGARLGPAAQERLRALNAELSTLSTEFGLLSDVRYPTFAGTGVPRDFVEFPSQVNEVWLRDPGIVERYARHHVTGAPLPDDLRARLIDPAPPFGEGFATTEYLAAVLLDLAWHRLTPGEQVDDVEAFEAAALAAAGIPPGSCLRAIAAPTSTMSSLAGTRPPTTPTSGARCSTPTPSSGSGNRAACGEGTARCSPRRRCPAGVPSTRWRPIAPSVAVTPRSPRS